MAHIGVEAPPRPATVSSINAMPIPDRVKYLYRTAIAYTSGTFSVTSDTRGHMLRGKYTDPDGIERSLVVSVSVYTLYVQIFVDGSDGFSGAWIRGAAEYLKALTRA